MAEIGKGFLGDICKKLGVPAWVAVAGAGLAVWWFWLRKK